MAQHRSKEEWNELLIAYENRDGTQIEFCEENGISPAALGNHLLKDPSHSNTTRLVELAAPKEDVSFSTGHELMELNYHHENIGAIMIRTRVNSLSKVITQLNSK